MTKSATAEVAKITRGRPSNYNPRLHPRVAARCADVGLTDVEISELMGVSVRTIAEWKWRYPKFLQALKSGREPADDRVERSLYARAIAGDVTACIFWLKNRRPGEWRDRREVEMSHDIKGLTSVDDIKAAVVKELGEAMAAQFMAALEAGEPAMLELKAEPASPISTDNRDDDESSSKYKGLGDGD